MLNWLPITELVDFSIAKCCFSALHDPNWPKYLPIKLQVSKRTTRKDNKTILERGEKNTFNDLVFTTFNDLPKAVRVHSFFIYKHSVFLAQIQYA